MSKNRVFLIIGGLIALFAVGGGIFVARKASPAAVTPMPSATLVPGAAHARGNITPDVPCAAADAGTATTAAGTPNPDAPTRVDVLFLLDSTGSMGGAIEGVKNSIKAFVAEFQQREMDVRVGLIAFRDRTIGEEPQMLLFNDQLFTTDPNCFSNAVSKLVADGGGDDPESDLDALVLAARQPFRPDADRKVIILITDAPPKIPDKDTPSIDDAIRALREHQINFLYLIVHDLPVFHQIQKASGLPGDILPLLDAETGKVEFDRLLPEIARKVAKPS